MRNHARQIAAMMRIFSLQGNDDGAAQLFSFSTDVQRTVAPQTSPTGKSVQLQKRATTIFRTSEALP
jgi:hypothetical protein